MHCDGENPSHNKYSDQSFLHILGTHLPQADKNKKQAGAELGQAQLKLRLGITLIKIHYMKNLRN